MRGPSIAAMCPHPHLITGYPSSFTKDDSHFSLLGVTERPPSLQAARPPQQIWVLAFLSLPLCCELQCEFWKVLETNAPEVWAQGRHAFDPGSAVAILGHSPPASGLLPEGPAPATRAVQAPPCCPCSPSELSSLLEVPEGPTAQGPYRLV